MNIKFILLAAAFLLSSCAVTAKIPMTRFESPEASGQMKGEVLLGYQGRNEVEFTDNFLITPPNMSDPKVDVPGHRLMAIADLGLLNFLDVNFTLPESRLGVKVQFLGAPRSSAEAGNISLAASMGGAFKKETETWADNFAFSTVKLELKETQFDFGLIAGWRIINSLLLYTGPIFVLDKVHTTYSSSITSQEAKGTIRSYGGNLGLQGEVGAAFCRLEGAVTRTKLGNSNVGRGTYGLALGLKW